ncbi:MAG: ATP-binding cassette domain-containing protein [Phycisphaerae bacterium]
MEYYNVKTVIEKKGPFSPKAAEVMQMFGLSSDKLEDLSREIKCSIRIDPGNVILLTGPSGCGKTVLLNMLTSLVPEDERVLIDEIKPRGNDRVIDLIDADVKQTLKYFSRAGLCDVVSIINKYKYLSEGQQWRCKMAIAFSMNKKFIIADEFCSNLDSASSAVLCENIRSMADREKMIFLLASSSEEKLHVLAADAVVLMDSLGVCSVLSIYDGYYHIRKALNKCLMKIW